MKVHRADAGHAGMLVHHPGNLHNDHRKADSRYKGDLLGLSFDLDFKFYCIFHLFSEVRLDPCL